MFQCSNVQMFKCSNVQILNQVFKCQMSIRLNFVGAYLRSSSGHIFLSVSLPKMAFHATQTFQEVHNISISKYVYPFLWSIWDQKSCCNLCIVSFVCYCVREGEWEMRYLRDIGPFLFCVFVFAFCIVCICVLWCMERRGRWDICAISGHFCVFVCVFVFCIICICVL